MNIRKKYIDIAKCIGIGGVVFEHSQYYVQTGEHFVFIRVWIISFFLQIFFICSGITNKEVTLNKKNIFGFINKKFVTLLIPYILWCFIYTPEINLTFIKNILWGTNESIEASGVNGVLWFFPVMFGSSITFQIIYTLYVTVFKRKKIVLYACIIILGILSIVIENKSTWWFGINISLVGALLMIIGYLLKNILLSISKSNLKIKIILIGVLGILSLLLAHYNMPYYFENGNISFIYAVWFARGMWGRNFIIFILSSIVSCLFILVLSMLMGSNRIFLYIGQNTAVIMCIHMIIYILFSPGVNTFLVQTKLEGNLVVPLFFSIINMTISLPICFFIKKYIPILGGQLSK